MTSSEVKTNIDHTFSKYTDTVHRLLASPWRVRWRRDFSIL
jgi:hypothetical protein